MNNFIMIRYISPCCLVRSCVMRPFHIAILLMGCYLTSDLVRADEIHLHNGAIYKGTIVTESDHNVEIKMGAGTLGFARSRIAKIIRDQTPPAEPQLTPTTVQPTVMTTQPSTPESRSTQRSAPPRLESAPPPHNNVPTAPAALVIQPTDLEDGAAKSSATPNIEFRPDPVSRLESPATVSTTTTVESDPLKTPDPSTDVNRVNSPAVVATPSVPHRSINLIDAYDQGLIFIQVQGIDLQRVNIKLISMTQQPLAINIPTGTQFIPRNPDTKRQGLISTKTLNIMLPGNNEAETIVEAVALDRVLSVPTEANAFSVTMGDPKWVELAQRLADAQTDAATQQAAIWIAVQDVNFEEMGILLYSDMYGNSHRQIEPLQAAFALLLCADSGIDIKKRRIWRDHHILVAALAADDMARQGILGVWALAQLRDLGYAGKDRTGVILAILEKSQEEIMIREALKIINRDRLVEALPVLRRMIPKISESLLDDIRKTIVTLEQTSLGRSIQ